MLPAEQFLSVRQFQHGTTKEASAWTTTKRIQWFPQTGTVCSGTQNPAICHPPQWACCENVLQKRIFFLIAVIWTDFDQSYAWLCFCTVSYDIKKRSFLVCMMKYWFVILIGEITLIPAQLPYCTRNCDVGWKLFCVILFGGLVSAFESRLFWCQFWERQKTNLSVCTEPSHEIVCLDCFNLPDFLKMNCQKSVFFATILKYACTAEIFVQYDKQVACCGALLGAYCMPGTEEMSECFLRQGGCLPQHRTEN